uniref:Uncharacterized protein n=1 Tax=Hyaloperonospora arabidopsidis (strain Emoy2) TaxID=559515 RepID=M4BK79_HYAAE
MAVLNPRTAGGSTRHREYVNTSLYRRPRPLVQCRWRHLVLLQGLVGAVNDFVIEGKHAGRGELKR